MDYAANLAIFLLEKNGSIFAKWAGRMAASEQRALFGKYLGKGVITPEISRRRSALIDLLEGFPQE